MITFPVQATKVVEKEKTPKRRRRCTSRPPGEDVCDLNVPPPPPTPEKTQKQKREKKKIKGDEIFKSSRAETV